MLPPVHLVANNYIYIEGTDGHCIGRCVHIHIHRHRQLNSQNKQSVQEAYFLMLPVVLQLLEWWLVLNENDSLPESQPCWKNASISTAHIHTTLYWPNVLYSVLNFNGKSIMYSGGEQGFTAHVFHWLGQSICRPQGSQPVSASLSDWCIHWYTY